MDLLILNKLVAYLIGDYISKITFVYIVIGMLSILLIAGIIKDIIRRYKEKDFSPKSFIFSKDKTTKPIKVQLKRWLSLWLWIYLAIFILYYPANNIQTCNYSYEMGDLGFLNYNLKCSGYWLRDDNWTDFENHLNIHNSTYSNIKDYRIAIEDDIKGWDNEMYSLNSVSSYINTTNNRN